MVGAVDNKLDEAILDTVDFAGSSVSEVNDGFFVFAFLTFEVCFGGANSDYGGGCAGDTSKAAIIDGILGVVDEIGS